MKKSSVVIRQCSGLDELEQCVQLQVQVWGYSDNDVVPRKMFLVAQKIGGQVFGAFETQEPVSEAGRMADPLAHHSKSGLLAGFLMALPGYRNGHAYLHSHMLAVRPEYRNQGIGLRLKLEQRHDAIRRGIEMIEWTFDPLEIKNAYLNIEKLGAIARRYSPDFYGPSTSTLQGGLPTDRLHAEWWLRSERVGRALAGQQAEQQHAAERDEYVTITVPASIYEWKASESDRPLALKLQSRNRDRFLDYFSKGLSVVAFERDASGNGVYRLARWSESFCY